MCLLNMVYSKWSLTAILLEQRKHLFLLGSTEGRDLFPAYRRIIVLTHQPHLVDRPGLILETYQTWHEQCVNLVQRSEWQNWARCNHPIGSEALPGEPKSCHDARHDCCIPGSRFHSFASCENKSYWVGLVCVGVCLPLCVPSFSTSTLPSAQSLWIYL